MKKEIKRFFIISLIFLDGAFGYYYLEILFRGYSHWSMGVCGGICLIGIYFLDKLNKSIYQKALLGALLITLVEFLAGCILNLWLDLKIWDYSQLKLHFLGQISLLFTAIWYVLSFIIFLIFSFVKRKKRILPRSIRNLES